MVQFYTDYVWKSGIPYGIRPLNTIAGTHAYKIASDPYHKYISIESYVDGKLDRIIYDSSLLDFRSLKKEPFLAWEKNILEETPELQLCILRDQHDRACYTEKHFFKNGITQECHLYSIHGPLLSVHKLEYTHLGGSFNGIILYDANAHKVMSKKYEIDTNLYFFKRIISEEWE